MTPVLRFLRNVFHSVQGCHLHTVGRWAGSLLSIRHGFSTGLVPAEPGFMGGVEMRAGLKYFAVFSEQVPPSVESECACPRFLPKKGGSCRSPAEGTPRLEGEWQGRRSAKVHPPGGLSVGEHCLQLHGWYKLEWSCPSKFQGIEVSPFIVAFLFYFQPPSRV